MTYRFKLTNAQIVDAFRDEVKEFVPEKIAKLKKIVKPYGDFCKMIRNSILPDETQWFWIEVCKHVYMPKDIVKELADLKALLRMAEGEPIKGKITQDDIDSAKRHCIEDLADFQGKRALSKGFTARCPLGTHTDTTPSFSVKDNKFRCFSCGQYGDAIDFYMKINGVDFITAVKKLK